MSADYEREDSHTNNLVIYFYIDYFSGHCRFRYNIEQNAATFSFLYSIIFLEKNKNQIGTV